MLERALPVKTEPSNPDYYLPNLHERLQHLQLDQAKYRFNRLYSDVDTSEYRWIAHAADVFWAKCNMQSIGLTSEVGRSVPILQQCKEPK